jgi:MFS family permease
MSRELRWYDYFTVNIYFTGLMTVAQTMTPLVVPLLVQRFVGEGQQGSFYGSIRLWSLMVALLVQSLMGMLSDHSHLRWGRRRPFILVGTLANVVIISLVGFSAGLEGLSGYWVLFALLILMQFAANTAHGAAQGLIPDIVPEYLRGRYSGVKAILEVPVPVILVSFIIGKYIAAGNLWAALAAVILILVITMLITMFAPEKPPARPVVALNWQPFLRLALMTALFTLIILGAGQLIKSATLFFTPGLIPAIWIYGTLGLLVMSLAVSLGVWVSIRIGLGEDAKSQPSYSWWVINRLAFLLGATNLASFAVYFLQGRLGLAREVAAGPASRLIMVVGVFILLMGIPSGWLADRFGSRRLVAASGLLAALGTLVIILAPGLPLMYLGGGIVGAAAGLFYPANWALGTQLAPLGEAGRYLGISNLAGAGAGAVGAYIGGPIADYFTRAFPASPGLGYVILFVIYGILFFLSALAAAQIASPKSNSLTVVGVNNP